MGLVGGTAQLLAAAGAMKFQTVNCRMSILVTISGVVLLVVDALLCMCAFEHSRQLRKWFGNGVTGMTVRQWQNNASFK